MSTEIKQIVVDVGGDAHIVTATEETPIIEFFKNGEMAEVAWYGFGKESYNGKYVITINYK